MAFSVTPRMFINWFCVMYDSGLRLLATGWRSVRMSPEVLDNV